MNNKLYISMYHYTRDLIHSRYPGIKGISTNLFEKQLLFFLHNFNVVTMEQVIEAVESKKELPDKAILLTFDDGYIDNYLYAMPLLEKYGIQGSFFIPGKTFTEHKLLDVNKIHYILASDDIRNIYDELLRRIEYYRGTEFEFESTEELIDRYSVASRFDNKETIFVKRMLQTVLPETLRNIISSELFKKFVGIDEEILAYELYMSEEQIRTMKRHGMFIGVHGHSHYWLGNLPKEKMQEDILTSLDIMSEFINKDHWVMNYPYGSYNKDVLNFVKEQGACIGLTTDVKVADLLIDNPLELPRLDCNDFPPKSHNYLMFRGE